MTGSGDDGGKGTGRIRVVVLYGGRSAEHEVSVQSARNVVEALGTAGVAVVPVRISREGAWRRVTADGLDREAAGEGAAEGPEVLAVSGGEGRARLLRRTDAAVEAEGEVVFPVLHGTYGEDGTVQGLLEMLDVAYVGAGVLGSSVGMDKDVTKRLLRDAGLPGPRFEVLRASDRSGARFASLAERLGSPVFVKPANLGSSVGVHKAGDEGSLLAALDDAFRYDRKVLVEEFIEGREIECAVLGNDEPQASVPGEIVPRHEFYSYDAKYVDADGAALLAPAPIEPDVADRVRDLAVRAFRALCCEGMARVDFFLRGRDELLVNEINTIPGFTRISMYPRLWEVSGVPSPTLVRRLVDLAIERRNRRAALAVRGT